MLLSRKETNYYQHYRANSLSWIHALTLVETLVVVCIIGILIAVLAPAISNSIRGARSAACLANLRQLAGASIMYTSEHENITPGVDFWPNQIWPYLYPDSAGTLIELPRGTRTVFLCSAGGGHPDRYNGNISYGINGTGFANRNLLALYANRIHISKDKLVAFADCNPFFVNSFADGARIPVGRHPHGVNLAFADAHVETVSFPVGSSELVNLFWGYQRQ